VRVSEIFSKDENSATLTSTATERRAVEEVYENQRTLLVGDYSSKYLIPLADTCGPWSDARGNPRNPADVTLPSPDWVWVGEWHVDRERPGVDPDGWQYATNWTGSWSPQRSMTTVVRRRRWIRERVLKRTSDLELDGECAVQGSDESNAPTRLDAPMSAGNSVDNLAEKAAADRGDASSSDEESDETDDESTVTSTLKIDAAAPMAAAATEAKAEVQATSPITPGLGPDSNSANSIIESSTAALASLFNWGNSSSNSKVPKAAATALPPNRYEYVEEKTDRILPFTLAKCSVRAASY